MPEYAEEGVSSQQLARFLQLLAQADQVQCNADKGGEKANTTSKTADAGHENETTGAVVANAAGEGEASFV